MYVCIVYIQYICPTSGKDQNPIFYPHKDFVEHCSLMGPLTRQETCFFFLTTFAFTAFYLLLFIFICMCHMCGRVEWWGKGIDVISFGTIRDLVFEPLVNFSHHFSCIFQCLSLVCFRCANKPVQACSVHT